MPFNKATRSYYFRTLAYEWFLKNGHNAPLSWTEARLMHKGATVAAITFARKTRGAQ